MRFSTGDPLPGFRCASAGGVPFTFDRLAGDRILLVFLGSTAASLGRYLLDAVLADAPMLFSQQVEICLVSVDPRDRAATALGSLDPRITVLWDEGRDVFRRFGLEKEAPANGAARHPILQIGAFVIAENLRFRSFLPAAPAADFAARMRHAVASLPPRECAFPAMRQAPVLQIPDVFDRSLCRRLIAGYETVGGTESGFMRDEGGMTRGVLDPRDKRRRDCMVEDPDLREAVRQALIGRVVPEIAKAFAFRATRIERYLVACYDAADHGFFRAHRDNVSRATSHRRFALSINLNAGTPNDGPLEPGGFGGGSLCFPEFGPATYTPAPGEAVVFSCSLLHAAMPVIRGRRFVFLSFFYDDAAAQIRKDNRAFLDTASVDAAGGNPRQIITVVPDAPTVIPDADTEGLSRWTPAAVADSAPSDAGVALSG